VQPEPALLGRDRRGQVVALRLVASELREAFPGAEIFDAFGDHNVPQIAGQFDRRAHDGLVLGFGAHVHDERAVDLDGRHRKPLQAR